MIVYVLKNGDDKTYYKGRNNTFSPKLEDAKFYTKKRFIKTSPAYRYCKNPIIKAYELLERQGFTVE